MIKFWKTTKHQYLTINDFRKENPKFEVFYKNKKWQGSIFGWQTNSPMLKLTNNNKGKISEETVFDLNWNFLIESWQKDKGKIYIFD